MTVAGLQVAIDQGVRHLAAAFSFEIRVDVGPYADD